MSYRLINISSGKHITLSDTEWPEILEKMRSAGWQPEGTQYDIRLELDLHSEEDDIEHNLFVYVTINHRFIEWDGNYMEKENQIITDDDAAYMKKALEGSPESGHIAEFFELGAFRILSGRFL